MPIVRFGFLGPLDEANDCAVMHDHVLGALVVVKGPAILKGAPPSRATGDWRMSRSGAASTSVSGRRVSRGVTMGSKLSPMSWPTVLPTFSPTRNILASDL